jgi:hypothetical protein
MGDRDADRIIKPRMCGTVGIVSIAIRDFTRIIILLIFQILMLSGHSWNRRLCELVTGRIIRDV